MNEDKIDRRAHWVQWAITGIVLATGWCCRLEFTVNSLEKAMDEQHARRDQTIKEMKEASSKDHDKISHMEQWISDHDGNLP